MLPDATALSAALRTAGVADARVAEQGVGLVCLVDPGQLPEALAALRDGDDRFAMLVDLAAVDTGEDIELSYHLRSFVRDEELFVKARVAYGAQVPSVWRVFPGALYPEREAAELFGISLSGHPNPERLLTTEAVGAPLLRRATTIRAREVVRRD